LNSLRYPKFSTFSATGKVSAISTSGRTAQYFG
jgi:hypothetical protein